MAYLDITNEFEDKKEYEVKEQLYFIDNDGKRYDVDGKRVVFHPSDREKEVAIILGNILGGSIIMIPRINVPENIQTPDYIINGERYDLKQISGIGKYVIQGNLKGKQLQSDNFIIDITDSAIEIEEAIKQIQRIYHSRHYLWINKIFLIKGRTLLKAYVRK